MDNLHLYGYRDDNHLLCLPQEVFYLKSGFALVLYASFDEFLYKFIERASRPAPLPNPRGNGLETLCYTAVALYDHEVRYSEPVKIYDINNSELRFNHYTEGQYESESIFSPGPNATRIKYQISYGPIDVEKNAVATACLNAFYKKPTSHGYIYMLWTICIYTGTGTIIIYYAYLKKYFT